MTRKLILNATSPQNKEISTTISNANPIATDVVLETFANKLNGLTNNTYVSTEKIDTTVLQTL